MSTPITLITGARKGLGRYMAEHYLKLDHIVIGCSKRASDLKHDNYLHFELDVYDEKKVIGLFNSIAKQYGYLDNLVNNAGIASMNHCLLTPLEIAKKIMETNLLGSFLFCRESAKLMRKRSAGRIVNITSVAVPLALEGESIYAASKSALNSLTRILSKELSPFNITVNAVGPTPMLTDLIKNVPKEKIESLINTQTIKRYGEFEDITNVIDFFLNSKSNFITGQIIYLGGL